MRSRVENPTWIMRCRSGKLTHHGRTGEATSRLLHARYPCITIWKYSHTQSPQAKRLKVETFAERGCQVTCTAACSVSTSLHACIGWCTGEQGSHLGWGRQSPVRRGHMPCPSRGSLQVVHTLRGSMQLAIGRRLLLRWRVLRRRPKLQRWASWPRGEAAARWAHAAWLGRRCWRPKGRRSLQGTADKGHKLTLKLKQLCLDLLQNLHAAGWSLADLDQLGKPKARA